MISFFVAQTSPKLLHRLPSSDKVEGIRYVFSVLIRILVSLQCKCSQEEVLFPGGPGEGPTQHRRERPIPFPGHIPTVLLVASLLWLQISKASHCSVCWPPPFSWIHFSCKPSYLFLSPFCNSPPINTSGNKRHSLVLTIESCSGWSSCLIQGPVFCVLSCHPMLRIQVCPLPAPSGRLSNAFTLTQRTILKC